MNRVTFLKGTIARPILPRAAPAQVKPPARVLKFVPAGDLTIVDPVVTTDYITRNHALMIWDQLYGLDSELRPQPQMVEGHTVEDDGKRWAFKLHDREPVRGRDCVASIQRWAARDSLGQALMGRVAEMSAPEDGVFVIRL